jgi:hypothetical protein
MRSMRAIARVERREGDMNAGKQDERGSRLRAAMSVVAALSVLGLASVLWVHESGGGAAIRAPLLTNEPASVSDFLRAPAPTGVPSAESVFKGRNVAPEEPIAQF